MKQKSNKTIVLECYRKIIRDLDLSQVEKYIKEDYIQHSPTVKSGQAGILEMLQFLKTLPKPAIASPSPIIRVIAEGDFVAVHLDLTFMKQRMAVIDLYRLEDGMLAEHWDAGQIQPEYIDAGITMTNSVTVIEDSADHLKNKKIISDLYSGFLKNSDSAGAKKWLTPGFIEHNLNSPLLNDFGEEIIIHKIIAEGNFVVTHCELKRAVKTYSQFNIFKMEDDLIAEHWNVEQEVPITMAHENGMF